MVYTILLCVSPCCSGKLCSFQLYREKVARDRDCPSVLIARVSTNLYCKIGNFHLLSIKLG